MVVFTIKKGNENMFKTIIVSKLFSECHIVSMLPSTSSHFLSIFSQRISLQKQENKKATKRGMKLYRNNGKKYRGTTRKLN